MKKIHSIPEKRNISAREPDSLDRSLLTHTHAVLNHPDHVDRKGQNQSEIGHVDNPADFSKQKGPFRGALKGHTVSEG